MQTTYLARTGTTEDANLDRAIDAFIIPRVAKALGVEFSRQVAERAPKAAAKPATPAPAKQPSRSEFAKPYIEAFGLEAGSVYFARGLTIDQARKEHAEQSAQRSAQECADRRAAAKPFVDAFGAEAGGVYFASGMTMAEAHADDKKTRLARLNAAVKKQFVDGMGGQ